MKRAGEDDDRRLKRFCSEKALRVSMDALDIREGKISPKRAKVETSEGMIETLFRGMRGMRVNDLGHKSAHCMIGNDRFGDCMRDILSDDTKHSAVAIYQRDSWRAQLCRLFRTTCDCEEVWIASPQEAGGQVFRISFRRPISVNTFVPKELPPIPTKLVRAHSVDDMTIEEYEPGTLDDLSGDTTSDDVVVEELDDDEDIVIGD